MIVNIIIRLIHLKCVDFWYMSKSEIPSLYTPVYWYRNCKFPFIIKALIFPPGLDLLCAFYGCLYLGAIPITIRPPHPQNLITTLPTVRMIVDVSKSVIVLSIQSIIKLLKSREAAASIDPKTWPTILDIDENPKRKLASIVNSQLDSTAYLDFSVSTCGRLSGVNISHR